MTTPTPTLWAIWCKTGGPDRKGAYLKVELDLSWKHADAIVTFDSKEKAESERDHQIETGYFDPGELEVRALSEEVPR